MIIMNKLYKCALGLFTTFILGFACFSNANFTCKPIYAGEFIRDNGTEFSFSPPWQYFEQTNSICIINDSQALALSYRFNSNESWTPLDFNEAKCFENFKPTTIYLKNTNNKNSVDLGYIFYDNNCLGEPYTSLQCQTEYNLIPINEVTPNYCAVNFGMIDPQECPINEGTGAIVRSNLMINDIPYAQNQNINVFIPDFLAWNIAFNDLYTTIEVEGYNADEEYIENVINQEKLTPTNKDIEDMLTGFMTNYFPYLAIAIVFLYLARKIFKLFK